MTHEANVPLTVEHFFPNGLTSPERLETKGYEFTDLKQPRSFCSCLMDSGKRTTRSRQTAADTPAEPICQRLCKLVTFVRPEPPSVPTGNLYSGRSRSGSERVERSVGEAEMEKENMMEMSF